MSIDTHPSADDLRQEISAAETERESALRDLGAAHLDGDAKTIAAVTKRATAALDTIRGAHAALEELARREQSAEEQARRQAESEERIAVYQHLVATADAFDELRKAEEVRDQAEAALRAAAHSLPSRRAGRLQLGLDARADNPNPLRLDGRLLVALRMPDREQLTLRITPHISQERIAELRGFAERRLEQEQHGEFVDPDAERAAEEAEINAVRNAKSEALRAARRAEEQRLMREREVAAARRHAGGRVERDAA